MSVHQAQEVFLASQAAQQCRLGHHAWLPWIEWEIDFTKDGNIPSDIEGKDWADRSYLTRCANCGTTERWNV